MSTPTLSLGRAITSNTQIRTSISSLNWCAPGIWYLVYTWGKGTLDDTIWCTRAPVLLATKKTRAKYLEILHIRWDYLNRAPTNASSVTVYHQTTRAVRLLLHAQRESTIYAVLYDRCCYCYKYPFFQQAQTCQRTRCPSWFILLGTAVKKTSKMWLKPNPVRQRKQKKRFWNQGKTMACGRTGYANTTKGLRKQENVN